MPVPPSRVFIYHFTPIDNLPSILSQGAIHSVNALAKASVRPVDISDATIQSRRARTVVPGTPGGGLHDWVPFYFAPRSPMLFRTQRSNALGPDTRDRIVYLVSAVDLVENSKRPWAFTDGHAAMRLSTFYDDVAKLDTIDWPLMREKYWRNTGEDEDRERRRQAEFLVHDRVPLDLIGTLAVASPAAEQVVRSQLQNASVNLKVRCCANWYF